MNPVIRGIEVTTEEICEALIRYLELTGEEVAEKNYIKGDKITASVFWMVGPNTGKFVKMFRRWLVKHGFNRTS